MKISILPLCSLALAGLFFTMGCQKSSNKFSPTKNTSHNVNPITAHAINNFDFSDTTLTNAGWTKSFEDNFNTDLSKWSVYKGGQQHELECYQASNLTIQNGILQIAAKNETVTGPSVVGGDSLKTFNYSSGWIVCKTPVSLSAATPKLRIVARIKTAAGYGLTSVFWSFGGNWPTNGEIDYVGAIGNDTKTYATNYFYGTAINKNQVTNGELFNPTDGDLSTGFHVYEMEWSKDALTSYLDGKLVETKTGSYIADLFGKTEYISLNLAIGGLYYSNFDATKVQTGSMYVDYVKVFASNN